MLMRKGLERTSESKSDFKPVDICGWYAGADDHFGFVVSEGVIEDGPTHHFAAAQGSWTDTILKVAKILDVPVEVVCR